MNRRTFLAGTGAVLLAAPLVAEAQQKRAARLGMLWARAPAPAQTEAFEQGLRDLGWVKGQNVHFESRFADGALDRLPRLAAELVGLNVDVIVAVAAPETAAARQATKTIMTPEVSTKQLEILKQVVPRVARVAVIWDAANPTKAADWRAVRSSAQTLGIALQPREVRRSADFDEAFAAIRRERPDALVILADPLTVNMRATIVEFAAKERVPAMYPLQVFVDSGGLMSYGADLTDLFRRAPRYVDRILHGAKPADLPVEQATKFDLVINLKTAKALGLTIPPSLLGRADQVIE